MFTPDTPITEAGRYILAVQLGIILDAETAVLQADETAVHESRKAIRRTFTAFRLLEPFFREETFDYFRWRLRKVMRRLGRARDMTVFVHKLEHLKQELPSTVAFEAFIAHWQAQKTAADVELRYFMEKPKRQIFWGEYQQFLHTPGARVLPTTTVQPVKVKHVAPLLIAQRVAAVRAYEDLLNDPQSKHLHQLRIQCKELRYTLEFFAPLLGPEIGDVLVAVKGLQEHLGHINDVHVAVGMVKEVAGMETAVSAYCTAKETELICLVQELPTLWQTFDTIAWRQNLGTAVSVL